MERKKHKYPDKMPNMSNLIMHDDSSQQESIQVTTGETTGAKNLIGNHILTKKFTSYPHQPHWKLHYQMELPLHFQSSIPGFLKEHRIKIRFRSNIIRL